jgi:hypothetical protein
MTSSSKLNSDPLDYKKTHTPCLLQRINSMGLSHKPHASCNASLSGAGSALNGIKFSPKSSPDGPSTNPEASIVEAIIWVSYPFEQNFIVSLLALFGILARAFLSALSSAQRADLVAEFNRHTEPAASYQPMVHQRPLDVMVYSYMCSLAGLNLQSDHRFVHCFNPPQNFSLHTQAIGRTYRLNQKRTVVVLNYYTINSFCSSI